MVVRWGGGSTKEKYGGGMLGENMGERGMSAMEIWKKGNVLRKNMAISGKSTKEKYGGVLREKMAEEGGVPKKIRQKRDKEKERSAKEIHGAGEKKEKCGRKGEKCYGKIWEKGKGVCTKELRKAMRGGGREVNKRRR